MVALKASRMFSPGLFTFVGLMVVSGDWLYAPYHSGYVLMICLRF